MKDLFVLYFGYAFILSLGLYVVISWFGDKHLQADKRDTLTLWLLGAHEDIWTKHCNNMFDSVFGPRHFSLRCLLRSATSSVIAVGLLYILFGPILGLLDTYIPDGESFWKILALGAIINLIPDYISLMETRWILRRFEYVKSRIFLFVILIGDVFFSAAIILAIITLWRGINGQALLEVGEILGAFTVYSIFFYSTFLTSVWVWLYCLSTAIMRLFSGHLSKVLEVEGRPVRQLGLVGSVLFFSILMGASLLPNGSFNEAVCRLPGNAVPYHCVRTAATPERQLAYLETHFNDVDLVEVADKFDRKFAVHGLTIMADIVRAQEDYCNESLEANKHCFFPALFYDLGRGVKTDYSRAVELYKKSCKAGHQSACFNLGTHHDNGVGVPINKSRAAELFPGPCEFGNVKACFLLAQAYSKGEGVKFDNARAEKYFEMACNGEYQVGCFFLGMLYVTGSGIEADTWRAVRLFNKACNSGLQEACFFLGIMYSSGDGVSIDKNRAEELYMIACESQHYGACVNIGKVYPHHQRVRASNLENIEHYITACDGGYQQACIVLAHRYTTGDYITVNPELAMELYSQACERDYQVACFFLGFMHFWGEGVVLNQTLAIKLYTSACNGKIAVACINLGYIYSNGSGVPVSKSHAIEFYSKACAGGLELACKFAMSTEGKSEE